ncbi:MAG: hypothetical protein JJW00_09980, partial [Sulfurimonas sp.]|nr:hypothetical protein [Sulfurimonas sp.]
MLLHKLFLNIISLIFLVSTLHAQTISSDRINEILQSKKEELLSKYDPNSVVKPKKKIVSKDDYISKNLKHPTKKQYQIAKELTKGKYEKTPAFNKRVEEEQSLVQKANDTIDAAYQKELNIYNDKVNKVIEKADNDYKKELQEYKQKVAKINQNLQNTKENMNKLLATTLQDALKLSQGKIKIDGFDNYNADDEVFVTHIRSKDLDIIAHITVPPEEAQRLDASNNFKNIKPTIVLEYSDNYIYISAVKVALKNKEYPLAIGGLEEFSTTFKLNFKLPDTYIDLNDGKVKDKNIVKYFEKIEKQRVAKIEKQRVAKIEKEKERLVKIEMRRLGHIDKGSYIQPAMIKIKAGSFMMGSNSGDGDEKPIHKVSIKKDLYTGQYEVKIEEYKKFTNDT